MHRQRWVIALIMVVLALLAACSSEIKVEPTLTPTPKAKTVQNVEPQSQALMLKLTSPETNLITDAKSVSVTGITSPDATLSVNGRLVLPNADGIFSTEFELSNLQNPLVVNVIATSIAGEYESIVRPVVYLNEPTTSRSYSGTGKSALFGIVTSVTPSEIIVNTASGPVTLMTNASTVVSIHGWDAPLPTNLANGTLVTVMTDGKHALSALAVLTRPAQTRHFTGIVIGSGSAGDPETQTLTLMDDSGRQITATAIGDLAQEFNPAPVGKLVTAVLKQDLATGSLVITAVDWALDAANRIYDALALNQSANSPESTTNITALRWRLAEHGVRNVSMLINGLPYDGSEEAINGANEVYSKIFSEHHIGAPAADVTGLVTAIATSIGASETKLVTVQPKSGQPVKVKISGATPVTLFGELIKSGQLDLASRITVRYGILGNNATRVTVMAGNTLTEVSSTQLAGRAGRGEIQGTLTDVGDMAAVITILDRETGQQVSLQSAGAVIFKNGQQAEFASSMKGESVYARFDPGSYRLLELESVTLRRDEENVSGVVHSFIPKVADGNLTIRTPDGRLRSFSHDSKTSIRRDGLSVSIHDVRLGDLVRPNTRVSSSVGSNGKVQEIGFLSLKAPEPGLITGVIRGITEDLNGQVQVTVSNIWLDLIILKVSSNTDITLQGRGLGAQDLEIGQGIALGSYDPVTMEVGILALHPPKLPDLAGASQRQKLIF